MKIHAPQMYLNIKNKHELLNLIEKAPGIEVHWKTQKNIDIRFYSQPVPQSFGNEGNVIRNSDIDWAQMKPIVIQKISKSSFTIVNDVVILMED